MELSLVGRALSPVSLALPGGLPESNKSVENGGDLHRPGADEGSCDHFRWHGCGGGRKEIVNCTDPLSLRTERAEHWQSD